MNKSKNYVIKHFVTFYNKTVTLHISINSERKGHTEQIG